MLVILPVSATLLVGERLQLSTTGSRGAVRWTSSDPLVCEVCKNGLVIAVSGGAATIRAKSGSLEAFTLIMVQAVSEEIVDPTPPPDPPDPPPDPEEPPPPDPVPEVPGPTPPPVVIQGTVTFEASSEHASVVSYTAVIHAFDSTDAYDSVTLGKPTPVDDIITADLTSFFGQQPLGVYKLSIIAVGASDESESEFSDAFSLPLA